MNALRVFILTVALLAPGMIPALCGGACGTGACPQAPRAGARLADEPASCCSEPVPPESPARSPLRPRTPPSCCCIQGPMDAPRPAPAPREQAPDEQAVAELPRPWAAQWALEEEAFRGVPRSPSPAWRPGGGNPIQSVLCIWRN